MAAAVGSSSAPRKGVWEPLPLMLYGYAVHPLAPSNKRDTRISARTRLSTVTETSTGTEDRFIYRDVVSLEVGDEVYVFERYTPRAKEVEGTWYRGYVVSTARRPVVAWSMANDPSSSSVKAPPKTEETQVVFIGIFPASHIYIRDELADAEGRLAELASTLASNSNAQAADALRAAREMEAVREEEEAVDPDGVARKSAAFKLSPPPDQAHNPRAALTVYSSSSVRSSSPADSQTMKPLPPQPTVKSGDDTAAGSEQPVIDEIASALREWHGLMFQYLARRDYKLFQSVRQHIEELHLGRRQLLAQTLSEEETINLRRECVARLVSGNIVQGLDVIVRHPTWGGLVTVDVDGDIDPRGWVSAVRMYAMQTSLAYMDVSQDARASVPAHIQDLTINGSAPQSVAYPAFPDPIRAKSPASRVMGSLAPVPPPKKASAKFYHLFLDLRAFVASLCAPGETAELFFSLFNKTENRFVTEDFCAILNHNGVLARDPAARVRTLFIDLVPADLQDPIFLVCRIVRNGALKQSATMGSFEGKRRGSEASNRDPTVTWGESVTDGRGEGMAFRRPFGCAVIELTQLAKITGDQWELSATREHNMPIYVSSNETTFATLHQDLIAGNVREYEKSPRAEMLAVSVKVFHGDADVIVKENMSLLQDTPLTMRLSFPDVVFPGDVRNELYIKLWSGDFGAIKNSNSRLSMANLARVQTASDNIQVTVEVRDQAGRMLDDVLSMGSGEPPVSHFHSLVFQRNNQPTFGELVKLNLPLDGITTWHLFFTFRHRTGREKTISRAGGEGMDRPFAFAFLPLFPDGPAFLEDGPHTLVLYRADRLSQITPDMYLSATPWLLPGQRPEQLPLPGELARLAPPIRDSLTLRSSLVSTKFTQNAVLLSLLHWQQIGDQDLLSTILAKFTFVGEMEIVKFLRNIFDALFGILASTNNQSGEMDHLVFNALVTVLGIVQDRRFSNFQPVLDVYIEKHFNSAAAASQMIHSMNRLLANPTGTEAAQALRAALKVWHYIFKFIVRSRELQKAKELGMGGGATADHLESTFRRELRSHLSEVNRMMSTTSPPSLIGTQTIALQHFTSILPELARIFTTVELVTIATTFANAIASAKGKVVIWKLIMYLQMVKGFLFDSPQSRSLLVEAVVIWIKPHFGRFDEYLHTQATDSESARDAARIGWLESVRLCITIVAIMLDKLSQCLVDPAISGDRNSLRQEQDNIEYLLSLLPRLLDSYREFQSSASILAVERTRTPTTQLAVAPVTFPESYPFSLLAGRPNASRTFQSSSSIGEGAFNPGMGECAIVFLSLVLASPKKHILDFFQSSYEIEGRTNFGNLLTLAFKVSTSILENDAFPGNWLNVNILAHKVLIKFMDPVATLLEKYFVPEEDGPDQFDVTLWRNGFYMLLKLLSSDLLVIEECSPQTRRAVWRIAGDIRGDGATVLLRLWDSLGWPEDVSSETGSATRYGRYQIHLNSLVGHVVDLCLSHHYQLRNNGVHILYSMIVSEYYQSEHFDQIENEVVNKLDSLFMSDGKSDDVSRAFFIGRLRQLFDTSNVDDHLRERVNRFLDSVDLFLELLLSVRALPEGEEFADDRVIATLRLMNFIRRIGRDEIYIKYVHQLVNMHLQSQNYVEAALTLKLHSDLHEWDLNTFVPPMEDLGLPQQSQFHRKETLCLLILDYLGKGKAWESAMEICKELEYQHAEVTYNYGRLSEILRHQAALLEHIVSDQRYYPDYFRVAYYGNFPTAIRNKQIIYRGYEWEKFGAFCERMLNKHPGAQLLKTMGDPPPDVRFGNDQYIQCTAVTPEPNRDLPIFTNPDVPPAVRTYYEHSATNVFSCSRTLARVGPDGTEENWVEKTYFTTEASFPTVLRRSEVLAVEVHEISPIENAFTEVEQKTKELNALYLRYEAVAQTDQAISTNALSMTLNGAVDAPADSGIASFRHVFLNPDYVERYPDRAEHVEKLRAAIEEHVRIIDECLRLHGQMCPPEMLAFHETLEKFFRKNFHDEVQRLPADSYTAANGHAPNSSRARSMSNSGTSYYPASTLHSKRSMESTSTSRQAQPFAIPPLQLGHNQPFTVAIPPSPRTSHGRRPSRSDDRGPSTGGSSSRQTPLRKHLAHLARHGITGVASGPDQHATVDMLSIHSPNESFITVGPAMPAPSGPPTVGGSEVRSITGSMKGRLSRFGSLGSLSFKRRE